MPENKRLAFYEVEALMRATTATESKSVSAKSWLQPNDARTLLQAIDHDASEVYIVSTGRMFKIKYKGDKVWLSPTDGLHVPCGWFSPQQLRKELSEAHVITAS